MKRYVTTLLVSNFNSIKVRLELSVSNVSRNAFDVFQFHKGAIRTQKDM